MHKKYYYNCDNCCCIKRTSLCFKNIHMLKQSECNKCHIKTLTALRTSMCTSVCVKLIFFFTQNTVSEKN